MKNLPSYKSGSLHQHVLDAIVETQKTTPDGLLLWTVAGTQQVARAVRERLKQPVHEDKLTRAIGVVGDQLLRLNSEGLRLVTPRHHLKVVPKATAA